MPCGLWSDCRSLYQLSQGRAHQQRQQAAQRARGRMRVPGRGAQPQRPVLLQRGAHAARDRGAGPAPARVRVGVRGVWRPQAPQQRGAGQDDIRVPPLLRSPPGILVGITGLIPSPGTPPRHTGAHTSANPRSRNAEAARYAPLSAPPSRLAGSRGGPRAACARLAGPCSGFPGSAAAAPGCRTAGSRASCSRAWCPAPRLAQGTALH